MADRGRPAPALADTETLLESVSVSANTGVPPKTTTTSLTAGQTYKFVAKGTLAMRETKNGPRETIASGHKMALTRIASGEPVVKYGSPIGTATVDIEAGAHVHVHNVASARGRGDLMHLDNTGDPA